MTPFRILALDGGGLLGTFSASVLAELEKESGRRIVDHFDLITGTSTGGIIAIALAMGVPAEKILEFYTTRGPKISPPAQRATAWIRTLSNFFRPKFAPAPLRESIVSVIGEGKLRDAHTRLAIPAYEASPGRVYVFKT